MPAEIITIRLSLPYGLGFVNCYLVKTGAGFVLIDAGNSAARPNLEAELERAGCKPGSLSLIIITHGDFDHTGNAAYLRGKFNSRIAMHADDYGMAERGNMFWNRKKSNIPFKLLAPLLFRFRKSDRFTPDRMVGDGDDLSEFGFEAKVLSLPGHSKGSIGILTARGDLFCGDLFTNPDQPVLNAIMDNPVEAFASVDKLRGYPIHMVYPGHGNPFLMRTLLDNLK
jgi:glyoxylase-like metal-dependent hydrolase (beta-lactamase superfamily II)